MIALNRPLVDVMDSLGWAWASDGDCINGIRYAHPEWPEIEDKGEEVPEVVINNGEWVYYPHGCSGEGADGLKGLVEAEQ